MKAYPTAATTQHSGRLPSVGQRFLCKWGLLAALASASAKFPSTPRPFNHVHASRVGLMVGTWVPARHTHVLWCAWGGLDRQFNRTSERFIWKYAFIWDRCLRLLGSIWYLGGTSHIFSGLKYLPVIQDLHHLKKNRAHRTYIKTCSLAGLWYPSSLFWLCYVLTVLIWKYHIFSRSTLGLLATSISVWNYPIGRLPWSNL